MLDLIPHWLLKPLLALVQRWPWLAAKVNAAFINDAVNAAPHRPYPYSTFSDYVCWTSLTDQQWSARHLPPAPCADLPDAAHVVALFHRGDGAQKLCPKSTCLFPSFAQYLTDGFIRTRMSKTDYQSRRRNTSNHQIDMCPLYGRTSEQVAALRTSRGGRLKSQFIGDEEYSPFLHDGDGAIKTEFTALDPPIGLNDKPEHANLFFAAGGDRGNAAPQMAMINTLFLREHNRLAAELERRNVHWDDERIFQTARSVVIVQFIKIVVEEYINHISPYPFFLSADPKVAWNAPWNKPNWITEEFSLLYRWHSLIPDTLRWGAVTYPAGDTIQNNKPLLDTGLKRAFIDMSAQPAGRIGPFNTARPLLSVEHNALLQSRACELAPYAAYRQAASLAVPRSFDEVSSDPQVATLLKELYGSVEKIEFYPGLFAEDAVANSPLPRLILTMVAVDAFSQALTNPLLSEHAFNKDTFTPYGWQTIHETRSLRDMLARNCTGGIGDAHVGMTRADWRWQ